MDYHRGAGVEVTEDFILILVLLSYCEIHNLVSGSLGLEM